jgi:UDP-N-acetylmuramoyl-L-alanyl-D-glutamate--2,6-diaminopimelate ligase
MMAAHIHSASMTLRELLKGFVPDAALLQVPAVPVQQLTLNSRDVKPGTVFVAIPGLRAHGIDYAPQAIVNGASAVLWEPVSGRDVSHLSTATMIAVPNLSGLLGEIANRFFHAPSQAMRIAAVTGTNGKSTTAYLIADAAQRFGIDAGYSGTVGYGAINALKTATHTTPDVINVHRQLAEIRDEGAKAVGMEVSSHALHQHRINAVQIDTAVFTNLTRDHLDYHGSMQAYGEAKAMLFQHAGLRHAVINADDSFGRELLLRSTAASVTTAYGCDATAAFSRAVFAKYVGLSVDGLHLEITGTFGEAVLKSPLLGRFNAYNLLSTLCVLLGWDIKLRDAVNALELAHAPPGRMETHRDATGKLVVIDYAHTPDALEKALLELKSYCRGKLVCLFGCGGNRDAGKRVQMGAIAERLAEQIILTDDNPRYEDPEQIIAGILRGIKNHSKVTVERNRANAIHRAIEMASANDIVLIAGKGHEDYQVIGDVSTHFSDREVVLDCLRGAA